MKTCVVYFSRTGNTKRLAQAIAETAKADIYDIAATLPSTIENYELLMLGTPVEGTSPAKETAEFVENMNQVENKKAVLFCTYRLFGNSRTLKAIEKKLKEKGYQTVLSVSKKGMKPSEVADFTDIINEVKKAMEKLSE